MAHEDRQALDQVIAEDAQRSLRYATPVVSAALALEAASHWLDPSFGGSFFWAPLANAVVLAVLTWLAWIRPRLWRPELLMLLPVLAVLASIHQHLLVVRDAGSVVMQVAALMVVSVTFLARVPAFLALAVITAHLTWACYRVLEYTPWMYPTMLAPMALALRALRLSGVRDAEHRRRVERELARREAELVGLRRLRAVSAGVAHHFNNLLTVMLGSASLVEQDPENDQLVRTRLRSLSEAGRRAAELVQDLLLTVGDGTSVTPTEFEVGALHSLTTEREGWPDGVILRFEGAPDLGTVITDQSLLCRALGHLLDNAAEAGGAGSEVVVRMDRLRSRSSSVVDDSCALGAADRLLVSVCDDGPGFDAEALDRAFDPFWTTREPTRPGLGLACAKGLVELLGGTVNAANRSEGGARVTIEIPSVCPRR